ncbi:MAG: hypothetical protein ACP5PS_07920, partial [Bacteroidales bacterium]
GWSQSGNITARGTVVDTTGLPLAGVTVVVSGTSKATLTMEMGTLLLSVLPIVRLNFLTLVIKRLS